MKVLESCIPWYTALFLSNLTEIYHKWPEKSTRRQLVFEQNLSFILSEWGPQAVRQAEAVILWLQLSRLLLCLAITSGAHERMAVEDALPAESRYMVQLHVCLLPTYHSFHTPSQNIEVRIFPDSLTQSKLIILMANEDCIIPLLMCLLHSINQSETRLNIASAVAYLIRKVPVWK
jgi:hypothetical protein